MSVMQRIKSRFQNEQFRPGWLGIFINPFWLARRELYQTLQELAPRLHGNILDIGCGTLPYRELFTNASDYTGMEYDSPIGRAKSGATIFYDGKHFPVSDQSYQSILLSQVLEHIFWPDDFLEECHRILKQDGTLLLSVPFVWDEHEIPYDYARYSSYGLRHLLEKNGFRILEQRKTLADFRVIVQLFQAWLYKFMQPRAGHKITSLLLSWLSILALLLYRLLPKNPDLYLDNIILATRMDTKTP